MYRLLFCSLIVSSLIGSSWTLICYFCDPYNEIRDCSSEQTAELCPEHHDACFVIGMPSGGRMLAISKGCLNSDDSGEVPASLLHTKEKKCRRLMKGTACTCGTDLCNVLGDLPTPAPKKKALKVESVESPPLESATNNNKPPRNATLSAIPTRDESVEAENSVVPAAPAGVHGGNNIRPKEEGRGAFGRVRLEDDDNEGIHEEGSVPVVRGVHGGNNIHPIPEEGRDNAD